MPNPKSLSSDQALELVAVSMATVKSRNTVIEARYESQAAPRAAGR